MGGHIEIPNIEDLVKQLLHEGQGVAVAVLSSEGRLSHANPAMCFFLGVEEGGSKPKNSFINPDITTITSIKGDGMVFKGLLTIGNYTDTNYTLESKIFSHGGKFVVFAEANIQQLFQQNNKMSYLNQQVNNLQRQLIQEKKKLELALKELKDTQQMLVHSEKMNALGKLVAGVVHEINNPLAFAYSNIFAFEKSVDEVVKAYQESKEKGVGKEYKNKEAEYHIEEIPEIIKETKDGLERVKNIVEGLKKFSRLDEADKKSIDLIENVESTISIAKPEITKKGINLSIEAPAVLMTECYPAQLNQALLNVLINAVQAVEEKGEIGLVITDNEKAVDILIKDNGCGIPQQHIDKIFDPFFTTKPVGEGTGLGLSITYKIIQGLHKGAIYVESEPEKGSQFIISIPKNLN